MKKLALFSLTAFFVLGLVTPAFAQTPPPYGARGSGLIPCGVDANDDGVVKGAEECTYNDIILGIQGIINFLFALVVPIATIMIAFAGWKLLTADGDSGKVSEARGLMTSVIIGFIIMLVAWLIVFTLTEALLDPDSGFTNMLKK